MTQPLFSVITTKLQPPRPGSKRLARNHLLKLLDRHQNAAVTLVMGPAGYGKTTLLAQWFEELANRSTPHRNTRRSWLTLDKQDNLEEQFLSYLYNSLKRLDPRLALQIEEFAEAEEPVEPGAIIAALINTVAESDERYCLFLDDYQWIDNDVIHNIIQYLLFNLPDNLRVYIGSRTLPPFSLARLKVQDRILLIGDEMLRFDAQEAAAFIDAHLSMKLGAKEQEKLYHQTQGWPAALQLATPLLESSQDPACFLADFAGTHESIAEYLAEEVFHSLPAPAFQLLLQLSLFDRFSAALGEAISDDPDSREILENSRNEALLLQRFEGDGGWYQFHPLAREFLIKHPRIKTLNLSKLHRDAAHWFTAQGYIGEAVDHSLKSGDDDAAFTLLEQHARDLLEQGRFALLANLVQKLPQKQTSSCGKILIPLAWVLLLNHDINGAHSVLKQIDTLLTQNRDQAKIAVETEAATVRAGIQALRDQLEGCRSTIDHWQPRIPAAQTFSRIVMTNVASYVQLNDFRFDDLLDAQRKVEPLSRDQDYAGSRAYSLYFCGLAYTEQLRLADAEAAYLAANRISGSAQNIEPATRKLARLMLGCLAYLRGDLDLAQIRLDTQLDTLRQNALTDQVLHILPCLARLYQHQQRWQEAQALLAAYLRPSNERRNARVHACAVHEQVRLLLAQDPAHAKSVLEQQRESISHETTAERPLFEQAQEWLQLAEARIYLQEGKHAGAQSLLDRLQTQFQQQGRLFKRLTPLLLLAESALTRQDQPLASNYLNQALDLDPAGLALQVFADEGRALLPLLKQNIQAQGPRTAQSRKIIELLQRQADIDNECKTVAAAVAAPAPSSSMPEPLTEKETLVLQLIAEGLSNREAAERAYIGIETIKSHLRSIYQKMGVSRRTRAVRRGRELGLIS